MHGKAELCKIRISSHCQSVLLYQIRVTCCVVLYYYRPNGRVDQGFTYANGAPVQPQPVELALTSVATSRPLLQHGKEAALTRQVVQTAKPIPNPKPTAPTTKEGGPSPRPLPVSKEGRVSPKPLVHGGSPRPLLSNGKESCGSPRPFPPGKEGSGSPRPVPHVKEGYPVEARPRLSLPPPSRISKSQEELDSKVDNFQYHLQ